MNDPYLNHIQKQNQKITDQIIVKLGAPPPEVQKAMHEWPEVDGGSFVSTPSGIMIPASQQTQDYGPSIIDQMLKKWESVGDDSMKDDHMNLAKEVGTNGTFSIGGIPVGMIKSWTLESDDLRCIREQRLLRAASGRLDEYVWSDVLQAHVRIGEDLKA